MRENINKFVKFVQKNFLLYVLFRYCVTTVYNNLHMQSVLKSKWINDQMNIYPMHFYTFMINFLKILLDIALYTLKYINSNFTMNLNLQ